jgi:hypothetical protein
MALNLSEADKVLKRVYQNLVRSQINDETPILSQLSKREVEMQGKEIVFATRTGRNNTVINRADGGAFPTDRGNTRYSELSVKPKYMYALGKITGPTIEQMRSDKGAFIRAIESETGNMVIDGRRQQSRQIFGTSDGVIAEATTSSTTLIQLASTTTDTQLLQLEVGLRVDCGTVAELVAGSGGPFYDREITAIDESARTITISGANVTVASSGDFLSIIGNGGATTNQKEWTGLQTIVDSSGSLHGVDPATAAYWKATEISLGATPQPLSENDMERVVHDVYKRSGEWVDLGVCSDAVWRAYANVLKSQKRYVGTTKLDGGYSALTLTAGGKEIPIVMDRDAPGTWSTTVGGQILFLNTKHLWCAKVKDWSFMNRHGSTLWPDTASDSYFMTAYQYGDLVTDQRNAHGKLTGILGE